MALADRYYPLLWAFDLLGHRLYASQWRGDEFEQKELAPPEKVEADRAPLTVRIKAIEKKIDGVQSKIGKSVKKTEIENFEAAKKTLFSERNDLNERLLHMWNADDSYIRRYQRWLRRLKTETTLIDALKSKALEAHITHGTHGLILEPRHWKDTRIMRYVLPLSEAVLNHREYGQRRGMIAIPKTAFEDWLSGVQPIVAEGQEVSVEDLCRGFLLEETTKPYRGNKAAYYNEAKQRYPDLPKRAFERVWGKEAHEDWKRPGRRKSN